MSTIAKGEITLSPVNDAYTVSITPSSCIIKADFDGSNPQLDKAVGIITVMRGNRRVPFKITAPHISISGIGFAAPALTSNFEQHFKIINIPHTISEGWISFDILTEDGFNYATNVRFPFSVVRESTMLDWIRDWEGSKTKVGGTYIMTPKLFVGRKEDVCETIEVEGPDSYSVETRWIQGALTGVYIGPDLLKTGDSGVGIYGYLKDQEIFHINADGGFIGGWSFNETGLQSGNGVVNILSEGSIFAQNPTETIPYWSLMADGSATFANGNVKFMSDGSAEFAGKITSNAGSIGGWNITHNQINGGRIIFDSNEGFIGINASKLQVMDAATGDLVFPTLPDGGIKLWYKSASDFGLIGWSAKERVFQLGAANIIAGWNFNHQAIWTGGTSPALIQGNYADENALTIAPNGIRSHKWYIDANGTASFVGGSVVFNVNNAEMFGWLMRNGSFSSKHAAAVSSPYDCGFYVSPADISETASSSLRNAINNNGGIYMYSDGSNSIMRAYDKNGKLGFRLSTNGSHQIGNWYFNHESIYIGNTTLDDHGFTHDVDSMILSPSGLIGCMWKFMSDGSGALAGGNISWDAQGNVSFTSNVKLAWSSITGGPNLTKIDANGIYTGTISANNITAGTITTASIKQENKWALNIDGSGYLASKNITWDKNGDLNVKGNIAVQTLRYMQSDQYKDYDPNGWLVNDAFITAALGGDHVFRLPHLESGEFRIIKLLSTLISRSGGQVIFKVDNQNDSIVIGTDLVSATHYKTLNMGVDALDFGLGYYEIVGRGSSWEGSTIWHVLPIYIKSNA